MPTKQDDERPNPPIAERASNALLAAALGGLLATGAIACSSSNADTQTSDAGVTVDAAFECNVDDARSITSTTVDANITLADFTQQCDTIGGTIEIHPHCGGSNSCKGMSYDQGTQTLTEHSCQGLNTCAGFSCVKP